MGKPYLDQLIAALEHLAAPADKQVEYLRALGTAPSADELALEFDDVRRGNSEEIAATPVPSGFTGTLDRLDQKLKAMGGEKNARLWDVSALAESPDWKQVRRLASSALELLRNSRSR